MGFSIDDDEFTDSKISDTKLHKDLEDLLRDFIIQYVKTKPSDVMRFSEKYFRDLCKKSETDADIHSFIHSRSHMSSSIYSSTPRMSIRRSFHRFAVGGDKFLQLTPKESKDDDEEFENCPMTYAEYKDLTKSVFLFNALNEEEINSVLKCMTKRETQPGDIIIKQNDEGDYFYIISKGIFEAYIMKNKEPVNVKSYHGQGYFGEIALMYNCLRSATVISRTKGMLWCLDRNKFREIVMVKAFEKRKACFKILQKVDLFQSFTDYDLNNVADSITRRTYHTNECILTQGNEAMEMYIIESGEVLITRRMNNSDKDLFKLGSGEYFGEMSLIMNTCSKVSAFALSDVEVMVINKDWFYRLFGHSLESLKANLNKYIYFHLDSQD